MRSRWLSLGIVLSLCVVLPSFGGDAKIKTERKIVYGKAGKIDLELDLAMPADGKGPYPAVVCIHGGGWKAGSRQTLVPLTELLAKKGFVAVTVSYRFAPEHQFPAQIEDCKAAVRWLRGNANKYQVKADRIGAIGFSAGAHLSCLLGTADKSAGLEGDGGNPTQSSQVQAVVSYFGPTDFTDKTWSKDVEKIFFVPLFGGTFAEKGDLYRKCSPIVYCKKDSPPFLFFHGTKDTLVGINQSQKMVKKLREVGASADIVVMEGDGHGWGGEKLTRTLEQSVKFFQEKLGK